MACAEPRELEGFATYTHPARGISHDVYWRGPEERPGVILLHELPGMVEECVALGRTLNDPHLGHSGYQVHLPLLFGAPGVGGSVVDQARWMWCMRNEMRLLSLCKPSPITRWVAGLVDEVATRTSQARVAVIGMCLTGSLVLGLIAESNVAAVVASQPSLPFGVTPWHRRALGAPVEAIGGYSAAQTPILAMRYRHDWLCPRVRLEALAESQGAELPPPPEGEVQDAKLGNLRILDIPGRQHALLTLHRSDTAVAALQGFLRDHLG